MKRLAVLALIIAACGGDVTTRTTDPTNHSFNYQADVQEITLTDGTLCMVATNANAVAITCDWGAG